MNISVLSQILRGTWLIGEEDSLAYLPILNSLLGNSSVAFEFDKSKFEPKAISGKGETSNLNQASKGSIAIIPIQGPLMKNDQECGPVGMATIAQYIKAADENPNIDGIILHFDTPGGTVDGTVSLSDAIASIKKPNLAFADGTLASAGVWLAASANEIIASTNKTRIGSIGVMTSFADMQPAYEKLGVKFHSFSSDLSPDKNADVAELRKGNYETYKKEVLNPLAKDFIDHVKVKKPGIKAEHLTGKMYFAENLVGILIEGIGNLDFAINRLSQKINKQNIATTQQSSGNNQSKIKIMNINALNALLGVELESTDDGVFLNEEQLEQINTVIEQATQANLDLQTAQTNLQTAQSDLQTATDQLATANASIEAMTAEIAELRQRPGAETATVVVDQDKTATGKNGNVTSDSKSFLENLNAVKSEFGI